VDEAAVAGRRRQLKEARVSAPFNGILGARERSPGQLVNRDTTLTWLVDLDPVKVEFNVPEQFLSQVQTGPDIQISAAACRGSGSGGRFFSSPLRRACQPDEPDQGRASEQGAPAEARDVREPRPETSAA